MANSGKDYQLWVSPSGLVTTGLLKVEAQGDMTINDGISNEITAFKDTSFTAQARAGWTATVEINLRDPIPTGQQKLWSAKDADDQLYIEIKAATGSTRYKGPVKVAFGDQTANVKGLRMTTVTLSEDGTITRDTAP